MTLQTYIEMTKEIIIDAKEYGEKIRPGRLDKALHLIVLMKDALEKIATPSSYNMYTATTGNSSSACVARNYEDLALDTLKKCEEIAGGSK